MNNVTFSPKTTFTANKQNNARVPFKGYGQPGVPPGLSVGDQGAAQIISSIVSDPYGAAKRLLGWF